MPTNKELMQLLAVALVVFALGAAIGGISVAILTQSYLNSEFICQPINQTMQTAADLYINMSEINLSVELR